MDPLSVFYTQQVEVERYGGETSLGPVFAAPVSLLGRVEYEAKLVRDQRGDEVVSVAAVGFPASTLTIPVGSRVTVRGTVTTVLAEAAHVGDFPGSPDYYSVDLL